MVPKSEALKKFAKERGADLIGIAPIERFKNVPRECDPRWLLPEVRSVIVIGLRITRGSLRGIEEGVDWAGYNFMSYGGLNMMFSIFLQRQISQWLENYGYEGVPYIHTGMKRGAKRRVSSDKPLADISLSPRETAVLAGLGEIGYSRMFLSPEFGPRQRLFIVLTDAPLEPDPIFSGKICDECKLCIKECPAGAFNEEEDNVSIAGQEYKRAKLNFRKCAVCHHGGVKKVSPYANVDVPEAKGLYDPKLLENPYYKMQNKQLHHIAICGAAGCIRACMIHLEKEGKLKNKFHEPFRKRKPWWKY